MRVTREERIDNWFEGRLKIVTPDSFKECFNCKDWVSHEKLWKFKSNWQLYPIYVYSCFDCCSTFEAAKSVFSVKTDFRRIR
jgi:hypothetical protein